ncbi:MAG: helix-turn-helix domain-containing protein [Mucinivorans sp.]
MTKVLDYILENTQNNKVIFKHSIKELAELFGVSRPSLSRVISEFVEDEILKRDGKNKFILNKEKI